MSHSVGPLSGVDSPAARRAAAAESLRLAVADARDELIDALAREGFRRCDDATRTDERWCGDLRFRQPGSGEATMRHTVVAVTLPEQFPFVPPKVYPYSRLSAEKLTGRRVDEQYYEADDRWHRDLDSAMCLFDVSGQEWPRWADGLQLLEQIQAWLASDAAGWPDDAPELDLERYLPPADDRRVILYPPLDDVDGTVLRLQAKRNGVLHLGRTASQTRGGGSRRRRRGWGADTMLVLAAGELHRPIRGWDELCAALGAEATERLIKTHEAGLTRVMLTYTRGGVPAALALQLSLGPDSAVQLAAMRSAPDDQTTRRLRAGRNADTLNARTVTVVGVGAIGSVVADLLHRGGVGHLHLRDPDTVLPGNTTRHLLGNAAIGRSKAPAVAEALRTARPELGEVSYTVDRVVTPADAVELLTSADVVVDATADTTATALLTAAARAGAGQLLSVSVLADGYAIRVDRAPTPPGQSPLPAPQLPPPTPGVYEAGCGSPISTTPPAAAWEAAAIAARHTVGLLTHPAALTAGEERRIDPAPERR